MNEIEALKTMGNLYGLEVIENPAVPEGWVVLRSGNALTLISPDGTIIELPKFDMFGPTAIALPPIK